MTDRAQESLEVDLEEVQQPFWRAALANSLTGYFGSTQYRFVARSSDDENVRVLGTPFPLLHFLDPEDEDDPFGSVGYREEAAGRARDPAGRGRMDPLGGSVKHW